MSRLELVEKILAAEPRCRGRVLDAGTGGGFMTALLAGLRPQRLVSVSLDEAAFGVARARLPGDTGSRVTFLLGDLTEPRFLSGECFDLIVGDYLLASVAGCRPFREIEMMSRLAGLLDRKGLLILTGAEPLELCSDAGQELVREVVRWHVAMVYLSGEEPYREYPGWWVAARLRERGLEVEEPLYSAPVSWSPDKVRKLAGDGLAKAVASGDPQLTAFARRWSAALYRRAKRLPGLGRGSPVRWTRDWVIAARPRVEAGPTWAGPVV